MIVVFLAGLTVGTIAGMLSWVAAAAYLESKRPQTELALLSIRRPTVGATLKSTDSRSGRRLFRDRRATLPFASETTREMRPSPLH
jgi:hypothetical protein